jgi:polynucleotide 5'-hydroxyl-kinase GRC3/NOL9
MVLGNEMNANMLKTVINGSILGLVAIEDGSALPTSPTKNADAEERFSREMSSSDCDSLATSAIRRSAEEALPYLFIGHWANTPLDPTRTRSIGQVLVRSINKKSRTLSILTPVSPETIRTLRAEGIALVLVRGRLDTPGWAYTEEYYEGLAATRDRKRQREYQKEYRLERESDEDREGEDGMEAENDEFDVESWLERTPWVEEVPSRRGPAPAAAPAAGAEEQVGLQNGRNNTSSGGTVSKTGVGRGGGGGGGGGGGEKVWKVRRNLMTSEGKRRREGGGGGGSGGASATVKSSQKD